jgi:ParB family chromosome partitioning protein
MARKNLLVGLAEKKAPAPVGEEEATGRGERTPPLAFAGRGALGAVTRSIEDLAARAEAARALEARLTAGEVIVALDPQSIDPSPHADRMREDDEGYQTLLEAIRTGGQQSPILVRPHPGAAGRYQVAFGHRRLRAAIELRRPVRAVIKQLSDREIAIAQGQENSARADLSFIERARFAARLELAGHDRETIIAALATDKTTVSRMISVATHVPVPVIEAIGPAPGIGRDRWLELADAFTGSAGGRSLESVLQAPVFAAASSDRRFELVQESLAAPGVQAGPKPARLRARGQTRYWSSPEGARIAKITSNDRAFVIAIDRRLAPDFGDYVAATLDQLFVNYRGRQRKGAG